ncbi:cytochrome P450 [Streptomyces bingchenggensis BCW-1]|uniref:Cytochrome P450 n=1 Tax=Streptomyces bingchenggensis (strain BCW-1) TaxID=749414 RepID=D7C5C8_STRBB|nr:cytochrome P450 [Streptomyces bingchenggensis]ADI10316.1 cytochrome P450 [Streptomyces bingchenggensis BCW-1]
MTEVTEVPYAAGTPLLGSMSDLLGDPLAAYLRARRDHGDVVRFRAGPPGLRREIYGVFSAEGIQQVLATEAANFRKDNAIYEELRQALGNGLLTSQDEDYRRQRRLIQPLFTRRRVESYATAVTSEAAALAARWRETPGGADGALELVEEMRGYALRVVGRVLFGSDVEQTIEVVRDSLPMLNERARARALSPVKLPRDWPTPANRRAARAQAGLYALCDAIISKRMDGREREEREEREQAPGPGHAPGPVPEDGAGPEDGAAEDLLTLLIRAHNAEDGSLTRAELREQVLVFFLAGHDTTATALTFALHLLARHPAEQRRVHEELDRALPDGRTPTAADLEALPRLTMVLKEAMRLFPPSPAVSRLAVAETVIGGRRIPAGAAVLVSQWVAHRHPAYWEDPERFDPERFTPQAEAGRPRYAYFPFGGGPRACIGQHFSTLHSVLSLATLLRAYEVEDATDGGDIPLGAGITLLAKGPVRVRVRSRT